MMARNSNRRVVARDASTFAGRQSTLETIRERHPMEHYRQRVNEAADFLRRTLKHLPEVGLLTGTGLGESLEFIQPRHSLAYTEIPHFTAPTVPGHFGRLLTGTHRDRSILALQGRFHLYEGYSAREVTFPIRVLQALGVRSLILSNAAGGLNPGFQPGDIMRIADHVNLTGTNPLIGPMPQDWGARFPDMSQAYDPQLARLADTGAERCGLTLRRGVYAGLVGPSLETPAEARWLRSAGADAVGFSTVLEVITAVQAGMRVLGLSIITNVHNPDNPQPASVEEILAVAGQATPRLANVIRHVVEQLDAA